MHTVLQTAAENLTRSENFHCMSTFQEPPEQSAQVNMLEDAENDENSVDETISKSNASALMHHNLHRQPSPINAALSSSTPTQSIYIAPKVDFDRYQAEVPDILSAQRHYDSVFKALDEYATLDFKRSAPKVAVDDERREKASIEFLQFIRNLSEPLRPVASLEVAASTGNGDNDGNGQGTGSTVYRSPYWTVQDISTVSLESDAAALEFLQEMNYNVDAAVFALCIHICRGKDWACTRRVLSFVDRLPPNLVFNECKDRLLRLGDRLNPVLGDITERDRDRDKDREGRLQSVANSMFYFPDPLNSSGGLVERSMTNSASVTESTSDGAEEDFSPVSDGSVPTAVYSKPSRVANNDKQEARKKWASIHARAVALLDGQTVASPSSNADSSGASGSNTTGGNKTSAKSSGGGSKGRPSLAASASVRPAIEDVQALLDEAVAMPHQIVILSSSKADEELADSLRSALGELLKALCSAREWVAEVRDALFNYSVNGILGEEETGGRRKSKKKEYYTTVAVESSNGGERVLGNSHSAHNSSAANGNSSNNLTAVNSLTSNASSASAPSSGPAVTTIDAEEDECNNFSFFRKLLQKGEALVLLTKEEALLREAINKAESVGAQMSALASAFAQTGITLLSWLRKLQNLISEWRCSDASAAAKGDNEDSSFFQLYSSVAGSTDWTRLGLFSLPSVQHSALLALERPHVSHSALDVEKLVLKQLQALSTESLTTSNLRSHSSARLSLSQVGELLQTARTNPLKMNDISYISALYTLGEAISGKILLFLVKAKQFRASPRLRGHGPFVLEQIQQLLKLASSFQIEVPGEKELEAFLASVENWKSQLKSVGCGDGKPLADSRKRSGGSKQDSNQTVPLRVVEALLLEGERLPFDLRDDLESLREKKLQAKAWLDRLKKSFVSVKVGTNRLRNYNPQQGGAEGEDGANLHLQQVIHTQADRLTLAEMKRLLTEGETLYQQPSGEQQSILAENPSSIKLVARSRDLDRAQTVVENAEEWISRVREVLTGSSEGDEAEPSEAGTDLEARRSEGGDENEADSDTRNSGRTQDRSAVTFRMLTDLLDEANSMPVAMEEAQVLRHHLQALQWASRLPPNILAAFQNHRQTADRNGSSLKKDDDDDMAIDPSFLQSSTDTTEKIKLSELQSVAREVSKIRNNLLESSFAKDSSIIKPLPEEEWIAKLLNSSEKWLAKVKRVFTNNSLKSGISLSKLRTFYVEGNSMPIDFDQYLKPIGAAIQSAEEWLQANESYLQILGIAPTSSLSNSDKTAGSQPLTVGPMNFEKLNSLYNEATALVAEMDETKLLKQKLDSIKQVSETVRATCARRSPTSPLDLIMFKEVEDIYRTVDALPLNLEEEKASLISLMKSAVYWETRTRNYFLASFMDEIKALFTAYSSIAAAGFFTLFIEPLSPPTLSEEENTSLLVANNYNDLDLYRRMVVLSDSIVALEMEGRALGVEMNATSVVCAYRDIMGLMRDSRNTLSLLVESLFERVGAGAGKSSNTNYLQYWGDANEADVSSLLNDIYLLLETLGRTDVNSLKGNLNGAFMLCRGSPVKIVGISDEDKEVLAAIRSNAPPLLAADNLNTQKKKKSLELKPAASSAQSAPLSSQVVASTDGGTDKHTVSAQMDVSEDNSEPQHADARSIVIDSLPNVIPSEEKLSKTEHVEAKVTRGSLGIVKRKVSDAFYENELPPSKPSGGKISKAKVPAAEGTANNRQRTSGGNSQQQPASTKRSKSGGGSSRKKRKSESSSASAGGGNQKDKGDKDSADGNSEGEENDRPVGEASVPSKKGVVAEVDRVPRQSLQSNIEKVKNMGHHLPDSLEGLLVLWARCIEAFRFRLVFHAKEFQTSAQVVLQRAQLAAANGSSLSSSGTYGAQLAAQVDQLLYIAERYEIKSSSRSALENLKVQVKLWSQKARLALRPNELSQEESLTVEKAGSELLGLEELKVLLKDGERLPLLDEAAVELLNSLKAEAKRAKLWIQKLGKAGVASSAAEVASEGGILQSLDSSSVSARSELVAALLAEAQTISVDLRQHTEALSQMCTTYCLCRHLYHGQMIGCDTCEDWYHYHCVGITASQAEKCDKYLCPRCLLKNSFQHSACVAAQVTHKWENMGDQHFKARQNALLKMNKKIYREEGQVAKLESYLVGLNRIMSSNGVDAAAAQKPLVMDLANTDETSDGKAIEDDDESADPKKATTSAPAESSSSASSEPMSSFPRQPQLWAVDEVVRQLPQWRAASKELDACRVVLMRSSAEREILQRSISLECKYAGRISQWMGRMQRVLWPSHFRDGDPVAGTPIGFWATIEQPQCSEDNSSGESSSVQSIRQLPTPPDPEVLLDHLRRTADSSDDRLLPPGMHKFAADARGIASSPPNSSSEGEDAVVVPDISNIEDVQLVLDAFRWMSWCSISLNLLRCPPTTVALRRLTDSASHLRLSDDKVVKLLSGISSRASSWKSRVRKFLSQPAKGDFVIKLAGFRDEGFHLPISTRLSASLRLVSERLEPSSVPEQSGGESAVVKEEGPAAGGDQHVASPTASHGGRRGSKGRAAAAAHSTPSTAAAARALASVNYPHSSDEEALLDRQRATATSGGTSEGVELGAEAELEAEAEVAGKRKGKGTDGEGWQADGSLVVVGIRYSKEQLAAPPKLTWPPALPSSLAPSLAATGLHPDLLTSTSTAVDLTQDGEEEDAGTKTNQDQEHSMLVESEGTSNSALLSSEDESAAAVAATEGENSNIGDAIDGAQLQVDAE